MECGNQQLLCQTLTPRSFTAYKFPTSNTSIAASSRQTATAPHHKPISTLPALAYDKSHYMLAPLTTQAGTPRLPCISAPYLVHYSRLPDPLALRLPNAPQPHRRIVDAENLPSDTMPRAQRAHLVQKSVTRDVCAQRLATRH
jgi:hypothetical protein